MILCRMQVDVFLWPLQLKLRNKTPTVDRNLTGSVEFPKLVLAHDPVPENQ